MRIIITVVALWSTTAIFAATPWEQYLDHPTAQNAARVMKIDYTPNGDRHRGLSTGDLQILQNQVLGQDPESFDLAIRLYRVSDGGDAEDLGVLLGRTARAQPAFFLREVARLRIPCSSLAWALRSPGLEYTDRPEAQSYEIAKRQEALRGVLAPKLAGIRQQCLAVFSAPN